MGERGHDCEETALLAQLNHHHERAIVILDGLSEEDLRRPVLPSGWSCLGMIADLATLERFWFRAMFAGEPTAADAPDDEPGDWRVPAGMASTEVLAAYRREAARADAIITGTLLDASPT